MSINKLLRSRRNDKDELLEIAFDRDLVGHLK